MQKKVNVFLKICFQSFYTSTIAQNVKTNISSLSLLQLRLSLAAIPKIHPALVMVRRLVAGLMWFPVSRWRRAVIDRHEEEDDLLGLEVPISE